MQYSFLYLVDWGNGFIGGFDKDFHQAFNTPARDVSNDLKSYGVKETKAITPKQLDELRGYHRQTLEEFFGLL